MNLKIYLLFLDLYHAMYSYLYLKLEADISNESCIIIDDNREQDLLVLSLLIVVLFSLTVV